MTGDPYNPLAKLNLGRSVADALLQVPVSPLSQTRGLVGAGVYAIYYTGDFPPYAPIADKNRGNAFAQPIYVGKAIPEGGRKGGLVHDAGKGQALRDRLRTHARSIQQVENIDLSDFHYRSLVVDDIWIPLGENMLIQQYMPIWNRVIDGFGNNKPGKGREGQLLSLWDVLHPGRKSMLGLPTGGRTPSLVTARLASYFAGQDVPMIIEDEGDGADVEDHDG